MMFPALVRYAHGPLGPRPRSAPSEDPHEPLPTRSASDAVTVDVETLAAIGRTAGLCAVGVCRAEPFTEAATVLHERKRAGLHGGMQFTYRNPDRSTDPARLVPGAAALIVGALEFEAGHLRPAQRRTPPRPGGGLRARRPLRGAESCAGGYGLASAGRGAPGRGVG